MTICVEFLMWILENHPEDILKYSADEDGGREAFESLYADFIEERDKEG